MGQKDGFRGGGIKVGVRGHDGTKRKAGRKVEEKKGKKQRFMTTIRKIKGGR